jgi:hypothetical protein
VCVCAFSLRRESPDMILGDKPLIFEVVLSHTVQALILASLLQQTWLRLISLANILESLSITESQLGPCCNLLLRRLGTDFLVGRKISYLILAGNF